jgi:hypothetical protein
LSSDTTDGSDNRSIAEIRRESKEVQIELLLALRESKEQQHLALREGQELQQRNRSMALTIRDLISANDVLMKELSKAKMIHPVAGGVPPTRGTGQSRLPIEVPIEVIVSPRANR